MKVGDLVAVPGSSGSYAWLKHRIEWREDSPMNLAQGFWLVGVFRGETAMAALSSGELAELVYRIGRKPKAETIGFIQPQPADIRFPTFYDHVSNPGGKTIYLCKGYQRLHEVASGDVTRDIRFNFGLSLTGIDSAFCRRLLRSNGKGL